MGPNDKNDGLYPGVPAPGELTEEEARYDFRLPSAADILAARRGDDFLHTFFYSDGVYRFTEETVAIEPVIERCWSLYQEIYQAKGRRPNRMEMHPSKLGKIADKAYLFESDLTRPLDASNFYYRVFGTALATVYDQDMDRKTHADVDQPERIARSTAVNRTVVYLDRPVLVHGEFQAVRNETLIAQFLCLPLSTPKDTLLQIFGTAIIRYRNSKAAFF